MKHVLSPRWFVLVAGLTPFIADAQIEIPLRKLKAPNDAIRDEEYGVSMTHPAGWSVVHGFRWGQNNEKTTIVLRRTQPGTPIVNFFYQRFGGEAQRPQEIREWFRSSFQEKQAAKQRELSNYQNEPGSLTYGTTASGLPRCSYTATFTRGSRRLVEYYVRVAGEKTYVMFLTEGTRDQIAAMREDIDRMADTVRMP